MEWFGEARYLKWFGEAWYLEWFGEAWYLDWFGEVPPVVVVDVGPAAARFRVTDRASRTNLLSPAHTQTDVQ